VGHAILPKINYMAVSIRLKLLLFAFISFNFCFAQPYVDVINTSAQSVNTTYKDTLKSKNQTNNYYLNITVPLVIDSQNTIILRFYGEQLQSTIKNNLYPETNNLYSTLLFLGLQHENKKWKALGLVMPKLSSDFKNPVSSYDMQLGGYGLVTYVHSSKLKIKLGLYYNREYFGNFFVPLAGVDWRVSDRFQMYGVLPTFYRFEYALIKQKLYAGLAFKSYTRSYRLSDVNHDYVKNSELQAKLFVDVYIKKRFVLFAEFGRTINYSPQAYEYGTKTELLSYPIYTKIQDAFLVQAGLAYRIRTDF